MFRSTKTEKRSNTFELFPIMSCHDIVLKVSNSTAAVSMPLGEQWRSLLLHIALRWSDTGVWQRLGVEKLSMYF